MGIEKNNTEKTPKSLSSRRFSFWVELFVRAAVTFACTSVLTLLVISMVNDALALYKKPRTEKVTVNSAEELADRLWEKGMIDHPWLFSAYVKLRGEPELVTENEVTVNSEMDYRQLLRAFTVKEKPSVVRLTVPTGATTDEIIDLFVKNGFGSREGFIETINSYPFEHDFVASLDATEHAGRKYRLDGYLYPDTYDFYTDRSEAYYIYKLLDRFSAVTENIRKGDSALALDEAVTIASMIQSSSSHPGQYEYLSSVFHNRLSAPGDYPFLDCPAASVYGISGKGGVFKGEATEEVKRADTPYNTFENEGLPPGPVCNPDLNALICAYRPADSSYRYFVTSKSGESLFASNRSEHEKNCRYVREEGE